MKPNRPPPCTAIEQFPPAASAGLADETQAGLAADPVLRLMRDYRAAWARWDAAIDEQAAAEIANGLGSNVVELRRALPPAVPVTRIAEARAVRRAGEACDAVDALADRIARTVPRTLAGLHASAELYAVLTERALLTPAAESCWPRTIERGAAWLISARRA